MVSSTFGPLVDHLWQSTIVVAAVALLTLVLRRNGAHVRYALWLFASAKFLVPFAALVALGQQVSWPTTSVSQPIMTQVIEVIGQPFAAAMRTSSTAAPAGGGASAWPLDMSAALIALWALGTTVLIVGWIGRWRRVASSTRRAVPVVDGRVIDALRRLTAASSRACVSWCRMRRWNRASSVFARRSSCGPSRSSIA